MANIIHNMLEAQGNNEEIKKFLKAGGIKNLHPEVNAYIDEQENGRISYRYDSNWSAKIDLTKALSAKFPNLLFYHEWTDISRDKDSACLYQEGKIVKVYDDEYTSEGERK